MKVVLLFIIGLLMHAANAFRPVDGATSDAAATALAGGFLLLAGYLAGAIFKRLGLPKLTGYLAAGIVAGPQVLALVSHEQVEHLQIFNGIAVALIGLSAGVEMNFRALASMLRSILWISLIAVFGTALLLSGAVALLRDSLPFFDGLSDVQVVAIAGVLGLAMAAKSPAVVVALRDETDAEGPTVRTALAVVVLSDIAIILLFALASSLARATFGHSADALETAASLSWNVLGSGAVGVVIGALIALYLRYLKGGALFIAAVAFLVAEVGRRIQLDPLLVALAAGMFIRNATSRSARLYGELDAASFPVYIAFFAVTGAGVHLDALIHLWVPVTIIVALRAFGFYFGTRIAAGIAKAPDAVRRYAGFGLMPQAGLALALAILFQRSFPDLGHEAAALVFGIVALNEMLAPVAFRIALLRSGEAGQLKRGDAVDLDGSQLPEPPVEPPAEGTPEAG